MERNISNQWLAGVVKFGRVIMGFRLSVFLILCFVLGGTSQDIVAPKLPLYLLSLFFIGWALMRLGKRKYRWNFVIPFLFMFVFVAVHIIYLVPLSPSIWAELPGRDIVVKGYEVMGMELPKLPLSLSPEKTLFALFDFLPPLALLLMMGVLVTKSEVRIAHWSIPVFAAFTVLVGIAQVSNLSATLYFYDFTNYKSAVGFFSNANHHASFLVMSLPFSISLFATMDRDEYGDVNTNNIAIALSAISSIFILLGILLTGSLAGYILIVPIFLLAMFFCTRRIRLKLVYFLAISALLICGVALDFFVLGNYFGEFTASFVDASQGSRQVMFATTYEAANIYFPIGTGPGSFAEVYQMYGIAGPNSIPHAHNDILETFLELGLIGVVLGVSFILWWGKCFVSLLGVTNHSTILAKCAALSTLAVMAHSVVDYPLRTISLSTFFVFCLCVMLSLPNMGRSSTS